MRKKERLEHITLKPKKDIFEKIVMGGRNPKLSAPPIGEKEFKNMIHQVDALQFLEINEKKYIYFVIELTAEYHIAGVQEMLKRLDVKVVSVLGDCRILVKGDKDFLAGFLEKKKIYLNIRRYVIAIKALDNQEKIGKSLQK